MMIDPNRALPVIRVDPSLTSEEKQQVVSLLGQEGFMKELLSGSLGAAAGYTVAKYFGLSRTSQILLAIAGFGVGRIVLNAAEKKAKQPRFANYNKETKLYEINENHKRPNQGQTSGISR